MSRIVEFEGKRYPRYWGDVICMSEAMARMRGRVVKYSRTSEGRVYSAIIETNLTDVPEGIERSDIPLAMSIGENTHLVENHKVNYWLRNKGLPLCDGPDPLAEKKADLATKERKLSNLKPIAEAAAFALEQAKGDNDEVSNELRIHWSAQEHAYLLAQTEVETAKKKH